MNIFGLPEIIDQAHAMSVYDSSLVVAASASEWSFTDSLALAATPSRPKRAPQDSNLRA